MKTEIRYKGRGYVGWVENDVFFSHRAFRTHFFYKFSGWGLSIPILSDLNNMGVRDIVLIIDRQKAIKTELMDFYKYGEKYFDAPDDPQMILNQVHFSDEDKIIEEKQIKLF